MEDNNKIIQNNEVITIANKEDNVLIGHHTYQASEFLNRLGKHIG